jgi:phospholipase C
MRFARGLPALFLALTVGPACAPETTESPDSDSAAWEAESVTESGQSTHLWLVESALEILARHEDLAPAKAARSLMLEPSCKAAWQQGLFDADFLHEFNDGTKDLEPGASTWTIYMSGATWKRHFFDADTGLNYKGEASPTAYTETLGHLDAARSRKGADRVGACREVGLALHFLTDLTQTMHASNFTALSRPLRMHANVETWAMEIQDEFRLADWSAPPREGDLGGFVVETARTSKRMWAHSYEVFADAYEANPNKIVCGSLRASAWSASGQRYDFPSCWSSDPAVRADMGQTLRRAQDITSQFLFLVGGIVGS